MKIILILFALSSIAGCFQKEKPIQETVILNDGWRLVSAAFQDTISSQVPGNVIYDLYNASIIPDPYHRDNASGVLSYCKHSYTYTLVFNWKNNDYKNHNLIFDGIDTYASIFLNGHKLGETNNMFRKWEFDVSPCLKEGKNQLLVHLRSPLKTVDSLASADSLILPESFAYMRKAAFQFGWDWAPEIPAVGIWRDVKLKSWDNVSLKNINVVADSINSDLAILSVYADIQADTLRECQISFTVDSSVTLTKRVRLSENNNRIHFKYKIRNPQLWQPAGMGKQHLYKADFKLSANGRSISRSVKFGVRDIKLVREKDSVGETFFFRVNGKRVFARGANYVPMDVFLMKSNYKALLLDARHAGFNMLRVWGGGIYESERFYELCDSLGIMVWQDFMFACALYPGDSKFLANVEQEVKYQYGRLSSHPCIALWCGNNEVKNAWFDWGWQKQFQWPPVDSASIWNNNRILFDSLIPLWLDEAGNRTCYLSSSPVWGWGHEQSLTEGDNHYWGVWWGEEPFESYYKHTGRFMSEFGFQSWPSLSSIRKFSHPEDRHIGSKVMKAHQKHPFGDRLIREYMDSYTGISEEFDEYARRSQMLQASGIGNAIRWFRVNPRCGGSLYWQFNDAWPAISWSSRDYYGGLKALHYVAKRAQQSQVVFAKTNKNGILQWYIHSDTDLSNADFEIRWFTVDGMLLEKTNHKTSIKSLKTTSFADSTVTKKKLNLHKYFAIGRLLLSGNEIARYVYLPSKPKNMQLPDPEITFESRIKNEKKQFIIKSKNFTPMFILEYPARLSDNAFPLLPGEERIIEAEENTGTTNPDYWYYE